MQNLLFILYFNSMCKHTAKRERKKSMGFEKELKKKDTLQVSLNILDVKVHDSYWVQLCQIVITKCSRIKTYLGSSNEPETSTCLKAAQQLAELS